MPNATMRPQSLEEMIGQDGIKRKARIVIGAALQRGEPLPHCLLTSSGGGLGKSTLGAILATEMFRPLVSTTGQCLYAAPDLRRILIQLEPNSLLLVDEFHGIGKLAAEELLLVLEEGVLNVNLGSGPTRMEIPPFTLIAATTKPSAISGPLMQRFGVTFHFDFYSLEEMKQIVSRMAYNLDVTVTESVCQGIAERSHGVPRKALRLAERVRDVAQAKGKSHATDEELTVAMQVEGIDGLGLRQSERQLLMVLARMDPRPVSARSLSLALGTEVSNVTDTLEPLLVRLGLMAIGPGGRRITDVGHAHLRQVEMERQTA